MKLLSFLVILPAVLAAPAAVELTPPTKTSPLEKRASTICGQYDSISTGVYNLDQNLWGKAQATSGSQCTTFNSLSGTTISWSTSWTWAGGQYDVKSFANVNLKSVGTALSSISTIPTSWSWSLITENSYTGSNIVANVAYDIFTDSTAGVTTFPHQYELMIWLTALGGAFPLSSSGSPIATTTISGVSWKLYYGLNGSMKVYSFVASSQVNSFSGDLKLFYTYLINSQGFPSSQYVNWFGAGTEPFTGSSAVLTVSSLSLAINTGSSSGSGGGSSGSGSVALYGQCGGIGYTGSTTCASGTCTYSSEYYSQCLP